MTRFIFGFLFLATIAYAVDKRVHNPEGNLELDAKLGSYVKSEKTFKVNRIESLTGGNLTYPPGMVPIGSTLAVMSNGTWTPPADCNTVVDGFMRAGKNGIACKVPKSCKDCIIPVDTTLPLLNNNTYLRGNDISGTTGGNNTRIPTQNVSLTIDNHPVHKHTIAKTSLKNSIYVTSYMSIHSHSPTHLIYDKQHTHLSDVEEKQNVAYATQYHKHKVVNESGDALLTAGLFYNTSVSWNDRIDVDYQVNSYENHNYNGTYLDARPYGVISGSDSHLDPEIKQQVNSKTETPYIWLDDFMGNKTGTPYRAYTSVYYPIVAEKGVTAKDYITNADIPVYIDGACQSPFICFNLPGNTYPGTSPNYKVLITYYTPVIDYTYSSNYGLRVRGTTGETLNDAGIDLISATVDFTLSDDTRDAGGTIGSGSCNGDTGIGCAITNTVNVRSVGGDTIDTSTLPSPQVHTFNLSSTSTNNEPSYVSMVWIIRVK